VKIGVERGRKTRPDSSSASAASTAAIPASVAFCHEIGLDYVSCSPFRVPIARLAAAQAALSLDAAVGQEEDGASLGDMIGDESAAMPSEMLSDKNLRKAVMDLLHVLDERELKIITLRFGLDGKKEMTLEEVGRKFKVTRERIRQLQNIALRKIKRALDKQDKVKS
jgi:RNA polymerase sigma factor (sigma-70 family)